MKPRCGGCSKIAPRARSGDFKAQKLSQLDTQVTPRAGGADSNEKRTGRTLSDTPLLV